jgi:hypothetical protein
MFRTRRGMTVQIGIAYYSSSAGKMDPKDWNRTDADGHHVYKGLLLDPFHGARPFHTVKISWQPLLANLSARASARSCTDLYLLCSSSNNQTR